MPELPEVETICRYLSERITDTKIHSVIVTNHRLRKKVDIDLPELLKNKIIKKIYRLAKYIIILLDDKNFLVIHLGMSGNLTESEISDKHNHIVFNLSEGKKIIYNDPRRFGLVYLASDITELKNKIGPEPLSEEFSCTKMQEQMNRKNIDIKNALMDGNLVSGIGNIYACEILFDAKISPFKKTNDISSAEYKRIWKSTIKILKEGILHGGSSIRDYKTPVGNSGNFQKHFKVYKKQNVCCKECNNLINKVKQNGRSTYFCKICQK
ncbi:bifunctional DNA-formamidopyrimidine glycosylase/DNA-(apurinic or apyrimidinic site) lyase [Anaplasmataceae bacterium AB001_6]|nr:bifunctional DNA-formamidopyrimidine glycosylase/DNA-(apurinic or apyrimidinic site) lyase [Anaplasmataceae bacterium AB001_6]